MKTLHILFAGLLCWLGFASGVSVQAREFPIFNGKDLSGWTNVNCAPETWSVSNGVIQCTGRPIGALRTLRQFENFVFEIEWRHLVPGGNAGIFVWAEAISAPGVPFLRSIEVQVLDNAFNIDGKNEWYTTHGDIFPIHGSTMKPWEKSRGMRSLPKSERSRPSPEWNHYRITATNGVIRLAVNGEEVTVGSECVYRKGYLALESEGGRVEYRNLKLTELPSSGADGSSAAPEENVWKCLYNGVDFRGWKLPSPAGSDAWEPLDHQIRRKPVQASGPSILWNEGLFETGEFVLDVMPESDPEPAGIDRGPSIWLRAHGGMPFQVKLPGTKAKQFRRFVLRTYPGRIEVGLRGEKAETTLIPSASGTAGGWGLGLDSAGDAARFMNIYHRSVK
ncbi:MAG: DUF1080 domain-containing protein [Verrucomicrobia bacterium]|nr:DUF1080 domain-containing protein [Verrucomicrobiota bacterium]